eukprot:7710018-Prorocentrum_lima.AAC.1
MRDRLFLDSYIPELYSTHSDCLDFCNLPYPSIGLSLLTSTWPVITQGFLDPSYRQGTLVNHRAYQKVL